MKKSFSSAPSSSPGSARSDLLQAFASAAIPNTKLVFAGDGAQRAELEKEAAMRNIANKVQFLGFVNQSQLPKLYKSADLMVIPSRYEPFGLVVNEAMLCGCPVVASDRVGAVRDLITHGKTGYVYPCDDTNALAETATKCPQRSSPTSISRAKRSATHTDLDSASKCRRTCRCRRTRTRAKNRHNPRRHSLLGKIHVKLLLYSHTFAPNIGGIETITACLARGLAKLPATSNAPKPQVTVVTDTPAAGFDDANFPFPLVRQPDFLTLAKLIRASDVVHIAGPALVPMFLSRLFGKPYVIEHHGYQAICPNGIMLEQPASTICPGHFQAGRYRKCIKCESHDTSCLRAAIKVAGNIPRHFLAKRAATNVAVSHFAAKRVALPRTIVIYHGLQCDSSQPAEPGATASSKSGKIRFGCVGRFVAEKGIPVLIEAAQRLRTQRQDFEVVLVGDGPQRPQIEKLIRAPTPATTSASPVSSAAKNSPPK